MAINYQTGVASTPTDLLNKLITFATAHGWTQHAPASGDVVLSNGTTYCGIDATSTGWDSRGCLSFNGGSAWNAQPNNSAITNTVLFGAGPYTAYHFFVGDEGGADYVHVTVEKTAGSFAHWVLGELVKSGAYTGGTYIDSTKASTTSANNAQDDSTEHRSICDAVTGTLTSHADQTAHLWIDYDSKVNNWQAVREYDEYGTTYGIGSNRNNGIYAPFWPIGDQGWNLRTPMFPALYFANRASFLRSPIGRIPNFRFIMLTNLSPNELVTYGGETWMVFPMLARYASQPSAGTVSSGLYGYAHRRT